MCELRDESYWKTRKPFSGLCSIVFEGMLSDTRMMQNNGWLFEEVSGLYKPKTYLYAFHPKFNLLGRGEMDYSLNPVVTFDFMVHQKKAKRYEVSKIEISNFTVNELFDRILEIQAKNKPKRKVKINNAEIIQFIKKSA